MEHCDIGNVLPSVCKHTCYFIDSGILVVFNIWSFILTKQHQNVNFKHSLKIYHCGEFQIHHCTFLLGPLLSCLIYLKSAQYIIIIWTWIVSGAYWMFIWLNNLFIFNNNKIWYAYCCLNRHNIIWWVLPFLHSVQCTILLCGSYINVGYKGYFGFNYDILD